MVHPQKKCAASGGGAEPIGATAGIFSGGNDKGMQKRTERSLNGGLQPGRCADQLRRHAKNGRSLAVGRLEQRLDAIAETFQVALPLFQQRQPVGQGVALALGIGGGGAEPFNLRLAGSDVVRQLVALRDQLLDSGMSSIEGFAALTKLRIGGIQLALGKVHGIAAGGEGAVALAKLALEATKLGLGGAETGLNLDHFALRGADASLLALLLLAGSMESAFEGFQRGGEHIRLSLSGGKLGFERTNMRLSRFHGFGLLLLFALEVGFLAIQAREALASNSQLTLGSLKFAARFPTLAPLDGNLTEEGFTLLAEFLSQRVFDGESVLQLLDALLAGVLGLFGALAGAL